MQNNKPKYITPDLWPLIVPVKQCILDPKNVRKHTNKNMKAIKDSLKEYGQRKPIVVQETSDGLLVRAGNGTLTATKILKREFIAVVRIKEDDKMAQAYAIADNRSAELAEWDNMALAEQILDLSNHDIDVEGLGFSEKEIQKILDSISTDNSGGGGGNSVGFKNMYEVVVECKDETEQEQLYERFSAEGLKCRVLSM